MSDRWRWRWWLACGALLASITAAAPGCAFRTDDDDPAAFARAVADVKASPGWGALSDRERSSLDALLEGRDNPWSTGARAAVRDVVADPRWALASAETQREMLLAMWRDARVRPRSVATLALASRGPAAERGDAIAPYMLRDPVPLGPVALEGTPTPMLRHELVVDGRTVHIDAPSPDQETRDGQLLSPEEAARSIAELPRAARDELSAVVLVPFRNPRDESYARDLGMPNFRTFMEGRSSGTVLVFPRPRPTVAPVDMLLHEVAHVWSLRDLDDDAWRAWEEAEREDGNDVSTYATTHVREDLAETAAVYVAMRGRPGGAEVRAMFAARFALLDRWSPTVD